MNAAGQMTDVQSVTVVTAARRRLPEDVAACWERQYTPPFECAGAQLAGSRRVRHAVQSGRSDRGGDAGAKTARVQELDPRGRIPGGSLSHLPGHAGCPDASHPG